MHGIGEADLYRRPDGIPMLDASARAGPAARTELIYQLCCVASWALAGRTSCSYADLMRTWSSQGVEDEEAESGVAAATTLMARYAASGPPHLHPSRVSGCGISGHGLADAREYILPSDKRGALRLCRMDTVPAAGTGSRYVCWPCCVCRIPTVRTTRLHIINARAPGVYYILFSRSVALDVIFGFVSSIF